jgi:2-oxoglutarate ferredoxin oxidoreductase subunit delta
LDEEIMIDIQRGWCKGCGICVSFCPEDVLGLDDDEKAVVLRPGNCVYCGLCELRCPDMAIEIIKEKERTAS